MRLRAIYVVAVLATTTIVRRSWCAPSEQRLCDALKRVRRPRILREPNSIITTIDHNPESSATFICEGKWFQLGDDDEVCEIFEDLNLNLESPENLTELLGLSMEWEIDGIGPFNSTEALTPALSQRGIAISTNCTFNAEQLFHTINGGNCRFRIRISPDLIPYCTSTMNISRQAANSNVQLQCSVRPSQCEPDSDYMDTTRRVYLQLQGLLGPPPGLQVDQLNSTTLYLSWNPPSTLSRIPISNYSVAIDNLVTVSIVAVFASVNQPSIDPNMTSLDLSQVGSIGYLYNPGCESLQFTVTAWNSVGEGANRTVMYSQESLHNIKTYTAPQTPGTLCILCEFNATTEAQGCEASIVPEAMANQTFTTTKRVLNLTVIKNGGQNSMIEAFDCISELPTGNYTVQVREIECSGGIGLTKLIHLHIRVQGLLVSSSNGKEAQGTGTNTQAIGFSVAIGILSVFGVLLLVMLIGMAITRKRKNNREVIFKDKGQQGTAVSQSIPPNSQQQDQSPEQDVLYDNDYNIRPMTNMDPQVPTAEYSYTSVSGQQKSKFNSKMNSGGIEMKSCVAYGTTA